MKTRNPIRVLTFSFFLLLIGFFVTWQGGLLDRFFEPEEKPYKTIIGRIPDSVKAVPLDTITQEQAEELSPIPTFIYQAKVDPLMLASSKTIVLSSSKYAKINFSPRKPPVRSLFDKPEAAPAKVKAKR